MLYYIKVMIKMNKNTTLEISLSNFKDNYYEIKKKIASTAEIIPILKDNAYGTYINTQIKLLNDLNIKIIGVANVTEGVEMRKLGFNKEILILNQPFSNEIEEIAKYTLTVGCGSLEFVKELIKNNEKFKIHIEICTGMGRTGIKPQEITEYIKLIKNCENITVSGIYTHFSCSDSDKLYTEQQIKLFNNILGEVKKEFPTLEYIHACNSAGILNFPEAHFNAVRPGLLLYGYYPSNDLKNKINIKPIAKLKAKISFLKEVPANTSISYGRTFITKHPSKIATVSIGYSSGVNRALSNKSNVVVNGKIAPIIGNICMDSLMVDVTGIDVKVNDDVYIWDNELVTIDDLAKICGTINYEILTRIPEKVHRNFISVISPI